MNALKLFIFMSPFFIGYSFQSFGAPPQCLTWFSGANVSPGFLCFYDCMLIQTTKQTETCPLFCAELCEQSYAGAAFFTLSGIYPGLTDSERALVADAPREMMRAFAYWWKAESTCQTLYFKSSRNDESDACRHYLWAALVRCNLGLDFSMRILDAHENNPDEPLSEKSMDLANNRASILACEKMSETGLINENKLIKSFQKDLNANRLIVLSPRKGSHK